MRTAIVSCFEYDMIMVNIQKALENQVLMGKSTISTGPWLQKKAFCLSTRGYGFLKYHVPSGYLT